MRVLTAVGPFAETGEEEYAHTPYSMVYMAPELRGIFKLMSGNDSTIAHPTSFQDALQITITLF